MTDMNLNASLVPASNSHFRDRLLRRRLAFASGIAGRRLRLRFGRHARGRSQGPGYDRGRPSLAHRARTVQKKALKARDCDVQETIAPQRDIASVIAWLVDGARSAVKAEDVLTELCERL